MLVMTEETFGPVLAIKKVSSLSEAIQLANDSIYGLSAFLYTADTGIGLQAARQIEAGCVWVNKIHKAYHYTPFGGMKCSGYGREKSEYGLDEYLELKSIYLTLPTIE
jgi:acyl-CoA reductase-like NAD-dependent aldehyde dehydrogenase